jgi:hypothetical protein
MPAPIVTVCPTYDIAPGVCSPGSPIAARPTSGMGDLDTTTAPQTSNWTDSFVLWTFVATAAIIGFTAGRCFSCNK